MTPAARIASLAAAPASTWPGGFTLPTWVPPVLASAGIVLGVLIIILQIRSDRRGRAGRAATPAADPARPVREVMSDAEELIDRLAARADAQAQRLETLIAQSAAAEQRLTQLLRAQAQAQSQVQPQIHPRPAPWPAAPAMSPAAMAAPATEPKPAPRPVQARLAEAPADPALSDIYDLADQGIPPAEIARRTGTPKGEVELILSLRRL